MTKDDRAKIHAMKEHGMTGADICYRFRYRYKPNDVLEAMKPDPAIADPALRKAVEERKAQRPKRKRRTKAQMEAARHVGSPNMSPGTFPGGCVVE